MLIAHLFYNYVKNSVIDLNNVDIIYLFNHSNVSASYYVFLKRESWKSKLIKIMRRCVRERNEPEVTWKYTIMWGF